MSSEAKLGRNSRLLELLLAGADQADAGRRELAARNLAAWLERRDAKSAFVSLSKPDDFGTDAGGCETDRMLE